MKRKYLILSVVLCVLLTTAGCSLSKITLTEKESDAIAEYAAHLLLKYDRNYKPRLMYREDYEAEVERRAEEERAKEEPEVTEAPEPTVTPEPEPTEGTDPSVTPEPEPEPEPEPQYELGDMFPIKNVKISYEGYETLDEYVTGTEYFPLTAPEGGKILLLKFALANGASKEKKLDTGKLHLTYMLELEDGERLEAKTSLLENDIQFINTKVAPETVYDAGLVFFIDAEDVDTHMILHVIAEDKEASVEIK
ncbi:MAG: hypothetical protein ILP10_03260 [Lachnospiraceae bacterium]|nr:hypothetical protein [Lachnospiraceae bacterium]